MSDTSTLTVTLPPLHPSQQMIARHPARFKVLACGRRWGKTLLAILLLVRAGLKGGRVWHVAPTYKQTLEGWDYLTRLLTQLPPGLFDIRVSELEVVFPQPGGRPPGRLQLRTADNPGNLRGSGLDGVVIDEAALVKPETWDLVLRPALADRKGWALFISTPQHFNWFWELWSRGEDTTQTDWASWQMPTWDNPYIDREEIDAAQRDMEPGDFDQEFGASFTAIGGAIFPLLTQHRQYYLRPMPRDLVWARTGIGMDWGTTKEHNAAVVCGSITKSGAVWIRSAWLDATGADDAWFEEAERCRRDHGATFARVDRSQSSARGRLKALGLEADVGVADVEARVGAYGGLIRQRALFFDVAGPGVREYFRHMTEYHRDPLTGKPVEEQDDSVDAGGYLVKELVEPKLQYDMQTGSGPWSRSPLPKVSPSPMGV